MQNSTGPYHAITEGRLRMTGQHDKAREEMDDHEKIEHLARALNVQFSSITETNERFDKLGEAVGARTRLMAGSAAPRIAPVRPSGRPSREMEAGDHRAQSPPDPRDTVEASRKFGFDWGDRGSPRGGSASMTFGAPSPTQLCAIVRGRG